MRPNFYHIFDGVVNDEQLLNKFNEAFPDNQQKSIDALFGIQDDREAHLRDELLLVFCVEQAKKSGYKLSSSEFNRLILSTKKFHNKLDLNDLVISDQLLLLEDAFFDAETLDANRLIHEKVSILDGINFAGLVLEQGAKLSNDLASQIDNSVVLSHGLANERSSKLLSMLVSQMSDALKAQPMRSISSDAFIQDIASGKKNIGEVVVFGDVFVKNWQAINAASVTFNGNLDLRGSNLANVNLNAITLGKEKVAVISIDDKTILKGCLRDGITWSSKAILRYEFGYEADKKWVFENPSAVFNALESAYLAKRKKEYFKKRNYFESLNENFKDKCDSQKLFELLCYAQDKPHSRTAEIIDSALKTLVEKEMAEISYLSIMQESFLKYFGHEVDIDWNIESISSNQQPFFQNLCQVLCDSNESLLSITQALKKIDDINNGSSCDPRYLQTQSAQPVIQFMQIKLFLLAKIAELNHKKNNSLDARNHICEVLSQIDVGLFKQIYKAYNDYHVAAKYAIERSDLLHRAVSAECNDSLIIIFDRIFELPEEKQIILTDPTVVKDSFGNTLNDFFSNCLLSDDEINWQRFIGNDMTFEPLFELYQFMQDAGFAVNENVDAIVFVLHNWLRFQLDKLITLFGVAYVSPESSLINKITASYHFLKYFADSAVVEDIDNRVSLIPKYFMYLSALGEVKAKGEQAKFLKLFLPRLDYDSSLSDDHLKWFDLPLALRYQVRFIHYVSLLQERALFELSSDKVINSLSLSFVDESVLSSFPEVKKHYDQLLLMTEVIKIFSSEDDQKCAFTYALFKSGYWEDGVAEFSRLSAPKAKIDKLLDAVKRLIEQETSYFFNENGVLDTRYLLSAKTFLQENFHSKLGKLSNIIQISFKEAWLRVNSVNTSDIAYEFLLSLGLVVENNETGAIFTIAKRFSEELSIKDSWVLVLTGEQKKILLSKFLRLENEASHRAEMIDVITAFIACSVDPHVLTDAGIMQVHQKELVSCFSALCTFFIKEEGLYQKIMHSMKFALSDDDENFDNNLQKVSNIDQAYFIKADVVPDVIVQLQGQYKIYHPVYQGLQRVLEYWQVMRSCANYDQEVISVFERLLSGLNSLTQHESIQSLMVNDAVLLVSIVDKLSGLNDYAAKCESVLAELNVETIKVLGNTCYAESVVQHYMYYVFISAIVESAKKKVLGAAGDPRVVVFFEHQIDLVATYVLSRLYQSGEATARLGSPTAYYRKWLEMMALFQRTDVARTELPSSQPVSATVSTLFSSSYSVQAVSSAASSSASFEHFAC